MKILLTSKQSKYLLAAVIIARSTSFLFSKILLQSISPLSLLSMRFLLAFMLLLFFFYKQLTSISFGTIRKGFLLGLVFTGVMAFEMLGLQSTSTSITSFLENSAIVIVPILHSIISKQFPSSWKCCGSILALCGVTLLTLFGSVNQFDFGIIYCLIAAFLYSVAILMTDYFAGTNDPLQLGIVQVGCIGLLSFFLACITGTCSFITTPINYFFILFLAVICSGFGFTLQPLAQKKIDVDTAGMFCALNPLTCTILGIIILHEKCTFISIIGCLLIFVGIIVPHLNLRFKFFRQWKRSI